MERQERVVIIASVAIFAACLIYVVHPAGPIYYPLEHTWRWEKTPGVPMHWYGRSLWAVLGGVVAGAAAVAFFRVKRPASGAAPSRSALMAAVVGLGAFVVALIYIVIYEWSKWVT